MQGIVISAPPILLSLRWQNEMFQVILAEVLAVRWQLVVHQIGQQFLQLQEESLAGRVAVWEHVK